MLVNWRAGHYVCDEAIAMRCVKHPDREARFFCQKTNRWFCEECARRCLSPKAHCKFRTACIIWALEHDRSGYLSPDDALPGVES
jgi:hypothetical protein